MRYAIIAVLIAGYGWWACQIMTDKLTAKNDNVLFAQQFSGE